MNNFQFQEMRRAMQRGAGWLTDAEIGARIAELQDVLSPEAAEELLQLDMILAARRAT